MKIGFSLDKAGRTAYIRAGHEPWDCFYVDLHPKSLSPVAREFMAGEFIVEDGLHVTFTAGPAFGEPEFVKPAEWINIYENAANEAFIAYHERLGKQNRYSFWDFLMAR